MILNAYYREGEEVGGAVFLKPGCALLNQTVHESSSISSMLLSGSSAAKECPALSHSSENHVGFHLRVSHFISCIYFPDCCHLCRIGDKHVDISFIRYTKVVLGFAFLFSGLLVFCRSQLNYKWMNFATLHWIPKICLFSNEQ